MAEEGGSVSPPLPRAEAAAEPSSSSSTAPSSSSPSSSPPLFSLSVKNPARSCAPDFVLTARADDSVAELKAKLSQTYEGKPPAERQTVRTRRREEERKRFVFLKWTIEISIDVDETLSSGLTLSFFLNSLDKRSSSTPARSSKTTRRSSRRC